MNINELFTQKDREEILRLKNLAEDFFWNKIPGQASLIGILAGGAFASWYKKETPKDYDLFYLDTPDAQEFRRSIINSTEGIYQIKDISNYSKNPHIKEVYVPGERYYRNKALETKCQFIFTDFKTREELIESFDYWHCRVSFVRDTSKEKGGTIHISPEALKHIRKKTLKRTKSPYWNVKRKNKFLERGWVEAIEDPPAQTVSATGSPTSNIIVSNGTYIHGITVTSAGTGASTIVPAVNPWIKDLKDYKDELEELKKYLTNPSTQTTQSSNYNEEMVKKLFVSNQVKKELEAIKELEEASKPKTWLDEFTEKLKKPWDSY